MTNSLRRRALTGAAVSALVLSAQSALAGNLVGNVQLTRFDARGSGCAISYSYQFEGTATDQTSLGQPEDLHEMRAFSDSPRDTDAIGTPVLVATNVGATQTFSSVYRVQPTDIVGTALDGAGPGSILALGVFDNTQAIRGQASAPLLGQAGGTAQFLQSQGGGCAAVANVIINGSNAAPNADAGPDQAPSLQDYTAASDTVTLDATGSSDPDGDPITYSWTQVSGPTATLSSATAAQPTFTLAPAATVQTLVFEVTVSDGTATAADQVTITVPRRNAANQDPVANAGPDQAPSYRDYVTANRTITLDGTASTDPDGDPITYSWRKVQGGQVSLSGRNTATPSFTFPTSQAGPSNFVFELTVTDGGGRASSDRVSVTIPQFQNSAPVADAGPDQAPNLADFTSANNTITLDGTGSDDFDNDTLSYTWSQVGGPTVTLSSRTVAQPTFTIAPTAQPQTMTFFLFVNDGTVNSANDAVEITIPAQASANQAPVADAGPDQAPTLAAYTAANNTFSLDGTNSSDPDGDPLTYTWSQVSGGAFTIDDATSATPEITIAPQATAQDYIFELTVADPDGLTSSNRLRLTVPAASGTVNTRPVSDAGPDQAPTLAAYTAANNTITLDGTDSSDPDGDPLTYLWTQITGPSVTLSSATAAQPTFTLAPGATAQDLIFDLVVNDGQVNGSNDRVTITVPASAQSGAPIADAGSDITDTAYQSGTNISLDATNSSDPDGDPLTYRWRQVAGPQAFLGNASTATPTVSLNTAGLSGQQTLEFEVTVDDGTSSDTDTVSLFLTPAQGTNSTLSVRGLRITSYVDAGGECQVNATFTATGATDDDGRNNDNFQARLTDGNDGNRLDNGQTGFVPVGDTRNIQRFAILRSNTAQSANGAGQLFYNVFDVIGNGSNARVGQRVSRVPVDLNAMAAAGGTCATTASTVRGTNAVPLAEAGPDQSFRNVRTAQTVTLDGTGSSDADNDPLTYGWTQVSGTPVTLSSNTAAQPTFSFLPSQAETLVFELVVDDGQAASGADRVSVAFTPFVNTAPATDAGPDQTVVVPPDGQTVQLDGSATSDADGDTLTYTWVQVSGTTVTLSDPSIVNPTYATPAITADEALVFRLTASDGSASASDTVTVNLDLNAAPVADAGPAQQALSNAPGGATVQLDATGSTDAEGDTLSYSWVQVFGTPVTLSGASTATPSYTVPAGVSDGDTAVFEVSVSDGRSTNTAQVTVSYIANAAPVADAGADIAVVVPPESRVITLSAAGSTDAEGDALTYAWSQVGGPSVTLDDSASVTPSFTLPAGVGSGTYAFEVEVSDGNGSSTDRVEVVVTRNDPAVADAGADQVVNVPPAGQTVTLDGSGSSDPEGDTLAYSWTQLAGPTVTLSDASAASPTFAVPAGVTDADDFRFELSVTDGRSAASTDEVAIDIVVNDPPTAEAGADQSFDDLVDGTVITLDGSGSSDPEGQALTYSWTQVAGRTLSIADANTATPDVTYNREADSAAQETFVFELTVSDGTNTSVADSVTLTVTNNEAPTADAGADLADVDAGTEVTLDATGSTDPDGDSLAYSWTQVSGPTVALAGAATARPSFTAPDVSEATTLVFEVTVDDGQLSSTDRVAVEVQPTGSITLIQVAQGGDVTATFRSGLLGLSGTVQTVNGTGQLVAADVGQGTYTVTADDARDQGFALTALVCSDDDSTADVAARRATIRLAPGEDVVCTFTAVNSRGAAQAAIAQYLGTRNALILSNGPDRQRRMDRLAGVAAPGSSNAYGFQLPGSERLPVRVAMNDGQAAFQTSLQTLASTAGAKRISRPGSWDVWAEGTFADVDAMGRNGAFSLVHLGADRRLGDDVLLGGMVSLDSLSLDGDSTGLGATEGDGWMAGPYVTARLTDQVYVDARLAYGQSDNSVNPLGLFADDFETDRWLADVAVFGEWDVSERLNIRPLLGLRYLDETQESYTDALGVTVLEQSIDLGELSFAPRLQTLVTLDGGLGLRPYAQVEGILGFGSDVDGVLGSDTRLRLEGGTDIFGQGTFRGGLSVFADGIGADSYGAQGLRVRFGWTFR